MSLYYVQKLMYKLNRDPELRAQFDNNRDEVLSRYKLTDEEKQARSAAIQAATRNAIEVPLEIMRASAASFPMLKEMAAKGNPNSVSDAGVGALAARAAVHGGYLNVKINVSGLKDKAAVEAFLNDAGKLAAEADTQEAEIIKIVNDTV